MGVSTESMSEMNPEFELDEAGCSSRLTNVVAVGVDTSDSDAPHQEPELGGLECIDTSPWELLSALRCEDGAGAYPFP